MTDRLLVDTNIVIYALNGVQHIRKLLDKRMIYVSFVTEVELLSFHKNTSKDIEIIETFFEASHIIEYSIPIKKTAIEICRCFCCGISD